MMEYYDLDQLPLLRPSDFDREEPAPGAARRYRIITSRIVFSRLFAAWLLLSGRFVVFHITLGVLACALVTYTSRDLMFASGRLEGLAGLPFRFTAYLPWLLWQIGLANVHVLRLAFSRDPQQRLNPHMIRMHTRLRSELSMVTLANSITLTPGTITLQATVDGEVRIHVLDLKMGDEKALRQIEEKVARTFGEA